MKTTYYQPNKKSQPEGRGSQIATRETIRGDAGRLVVLSANSNNESRLLSGLSDQLAMRVPILKQRISTDFVIRDQLYRRRVIRLTSPFGSRKTPPRSPLPHSLVSHGPSDMRVELLCEGSHTASVNDCFLDEVHSVSLEPNVTFDKN